MACGPLYAGSAGKRKNTWFLLSVPRETMSTIYFLPKLEDVIRRQMFFDYTVC